MGVRGVPTHGSSKRIRPTNIREADRDGYWMDGQRRPPFPCRGQTDCPPPQPPRPRLQRTKTVEVEKIVYRDRPVEKIVYRDRPAPPKQEVIKAPEQPKFGGFETTKAKRWQQYGQQFDRLRKRKQTTKKRAWHLPFEV